MDIPITYIQGVVDRIPHTNASVWKFRAPEEVELCLGSERVMARRESFVAPLELRATLLHIEGRDEVCWRFGAKIFRSANPQFLTRMNERSVLRNAS